MVIVQYDQYLLDYLCFVERTFCVNTLHSSEILLSNSVVGRHFCVCTIFIAHIIFDLSLDVFLYSVVYVFVATPVDLYDEKCCLGHWSTITFICMAYISDNIDYYLIVNFFLFI